MKITGTRSYILVEYDHRTVKIEGELTTTPAFYASIGSIKNWESPYENMSVTEEEKKEIINRVLEENNPEFKIIFEE
jgi:hypothetical protein